MKFLGISTVQSTRRIYLPKSLLIEMDLKPGDRVGFQISEDEVQLVEGRNEDGFSQMLSTQNRLTLPRRILNRLSLEEGDKLLICKENGKYILHSAQTLKRK